MMTLADNARAGTTAPSCTAGASRRCVPYNLHQCALKEIKADQSLLVYHSTTQYRGVRFSAPLPTRFNPRKPRVSDRSQLNEDYNKVHSLWIHLYRVDDLVEIFFSEQCELVTAKRFLHKALHRYSRSNLIGTDNHWTNRKAILACDAQRWFGRLSPTAAEGYVHQSKPKSLMQSSWIAGLVRIEHRVVHMMGKQVIHSHNSDRPGRVNLNSLQHDQRH
ncbi:hypothetical protein [Sinorhizobium sp. 7-81]|uniref:DDE-type integrase/transposase/recombinase n=1 Tax=Sinorhizobium sp. 7-81 TaxID=3049087 RepID=UPI0024C3ACE2|nr:hypothetical protein [Sinorhizobium sp. 7-81]